MEFTYATNIALVSAETNLVENIIWGLPCNDYAPEGLLCIEIGELNLSIGDEYDPESGRFYHEGELVKTLNEIYAEMLDDLLTRIEDALEVGTDAD